MSVNFLSFKTFLLVQIFMPFGKEKFRFNRRMEHIKHLVFKAGFLAMLHPIFIYIKFLFPYAHHKKAFSVKFEWEV